MLHFHRVWIGSLGRVLAACAALGFIGAGAYAAQSSMVLEAEAGREFYSEGMDATVYVQARIRAPEPAGQDMPAPARNVVLLVDRSGSMAGPSIAAAREAVAAALGVLADDDLVSVVLFGSEVETLLEAQRVGAAREAFAQVGEINAEGGAALYDGLSQAAAQLRRHAGRGTMDQLVLLIDGPSTKGPREREDFTRLIESFAREGIAVSTIGIGEDFDEDLLASLARLGSGRFHYAERPERLIEAVLAEVAPRRAVVARDAILSFEYKTFCDEVKGHGARPATVEKNTVTYRFPQLHAGQELDALVSGVVGSFQARYSMRDVVRVRLSWFDVETGQPQEITRAISCNFTTDPRALEDAANVPVYRAAVASLIRDAMQEAIEQLDQGEFRRALRALRRARGEARDVNYSLEDVGIAGMIRALEAYIAEVQARGMNQLDRKILRSGLFNQFEIPSADPEAVD